MRSSTSVLVTVLCSVELLADVVFVKATLLLIIFVVVNAAEVAVMFPEFVDMTLRLPRCVDSCEFQCQYFVNQNTETDLGGHCCKKHY